MAIDQRVWLAIRKGEYFTRQRRNFMSVATGHADPSVVVTTFQGMTEEYGEIVSELEGYYSENFASKFFLFSKKDDYDNLVDLTNKAKNGFNTLYLLVSKTDADKIVPPIKVDVGYEDVKKKEEELEGLREDCDALRAELKAKKKQLSDKRSALNKTFKPAEKNKLKNEIGALQQEISDIERRIKDSEKKISDMEKEVAQMRRDMNKAASEQTEARMVTGNAGNLTPEVNARLQYSNLVKCLEEGLAKLADLQRKLGTVKMKDDTKGKAFDAGAVVDKSVPKYLGLGVDDPHALEMLKGKLQETKDRIATLKDEVESGLESVIRSLDMLCTNYGTDFYDSRWTGWEKKCREYTRRLVAFSNKVSRLIKNPTDVTDPELMFCSGSKFKKEVEEPGKELKGNILWYKNKLKKMFTFANSLEKLYVLDRNMFTNRDRDYKNVKNGVVTDQLKNDFGDAAHTTVSGLPNCLEIACGRSRLESQYDHKSVRSLGPYYIVIDKNGEMIEGPNVADNKKYINRSSDEAKAIKEVTDVLEASLKAGEWKPSK